MPQLETLIGKKKTELTQIARNLKLENFSKYDWAGLVIALCEPPPSEETKEVIRMDTAQLQERARENDLQGFSKLNKAGLILALAPHKECRASGLSAPGSPADESGRFVRVYHPLKRLGPGHPQGPYGGPVIGYCKERERAAVYTYLRGKTGLEEAQKMSATAREMLARIRETPPKGADIIDPPL